MSTLTICIVIFGAALLFIWLCGKIDEAIADRRARDMAQALHNADCRRIYGDNYEKWPD